MVRCSASCCAVLGTLFLLLLIPFASLDAQVISRGVAIRPATLRPATSAAAQLSAGGPLTAPTAAIASDTVNAQDALETPESKLLQLLLAANLERTPQAVLKAWSDVKPESNANSNDDQGIPATVANAYESVVVLEFGKASSFKTNDVLVLRHGQSEIGTATVLSVDDKTVVTKLSPRTRPTDLPNQSTDKNPTTKSDSGSGKPETQSELQSDQRETKEQTDATRDGTQQREAEPTNEAAAKSDDATGESAATANVGADQQPEAETTNTRAANSETETDTASAAQTAEKPNGYPELKNGTAVTVFIQPKKTQIAQSIAAKAQQQVDRFTRDVMLGNWDAVKQFLAALPKNDADQVYAHVLTSLAKTTAQLPEGVPDEMAQQLMSQLQQQGQKTPPSFISPDDILQLADAAPKPIQISLDGAGQEPPDTETTAATGPVSALPPNIKLAPGMTIEDLPPEALAALQQTANANSATPRPAAKVTSEAHLRALSTLIRVAKSAGYDFSDFVAKLEAGTTHFGLDNRVKMLTTAELLMKSGLTDDVERFLPSLSDEKTKSDLPALKIWAQYTYTKYQEKKIADWLQKAWQINQWIVSGENANKADKDQALTKLIELSTQVDKELGQAWLNDSFTEDPQRGMLILSNLGTKSATLATQAAMVSEAERLKLLRLQNKAVEDLLRVTPELANQWSQAITLLARNWLTEAETSIQYSQQNSRQEFMQIDMYGNYYWVDQNQLNQRYGRTSQPRPIKLGDMLEIMPSETWQQHISPSLLTQVRKIIANLHLRINEEDEAFPYIEEIAATNPEIAKELVHEFLRIWTKNHDPNTSRRQRNPYIYFYGFDQKAEAIPLTRSKQERNLKELSDWVARIRKMQIDSVDEQLLANAFTTCHSSAEVFRLSAVKNVFGELDSLKPETIAAICQKMRGSLSANWRDVRNQEAKQTNRKEPEVQQEVLRGYDVALRLAQEALAASPDNWKLLLAQACLMYDQNAYSQTVQKSSEFSDRRDQAFAQFQLAAEKYKDIVSTLEEQDQSTDVFDLWFYAALGAVDLGKITDKTVPDLRQYPKIKAAIESLPGSLAEMHMAKVANNMFTRMSPIKPEIKFRYLRGGFEIVGDHPRAWEARNLYDYYKDLVSEIKLNVQVDGDEEVGHEQPFGIYVNLLHTSEIEREAGGFTKYIQNQNNMPFAYNYGRPTEDYRDKFVDAASQALEEHFEILNVTFVGEDTMKSVAAPQAGWRLTPYAYLLLKSRGPEIDRVAPLKLDMDFLDTSGYVVIPVESPALVIDSSASRAKPRPIEDLQITQTLDERQAGEGKLIVEISATAKGLVPNLDDIIETERENFEIVSVDDQGVLPARFDKDSHGIQILSDRSWTVEYRAKENSPNLNQFTFGDPKLADAGIKFQRYDDADLVEAEKTVELEKVYANGFQWGILYWLIPLIVLGLVGVGALVFASSQPGEVAEERFTIPADINPFTVLTLLQDIKRRNGISNEQAVELERSINRVERYYFGKSESDQETEDLEQLAQTWVQQAK